MHLVIIGNGITGVTAALTARQLQPAARITLVSAESAHHFSRPALMYVYLGDLRYQDIKPYEDWFWAENKLELVYSSHVMITCRYKTEFQQGDRVQILPSSLPSSLHGSGLVPGPIFLFYQTPTIW